jgi:hypothetical protein
LKFYFKKLVADIKTWGKNIIKLDFIFVLGASFFPTKRSLFYWLCISRYIYSMMLLHIKCCNRLKKCPCTIWRSFWQNKICYNSVFLFFRVSYRTDWWPSTRIKKSEVFNCDSPTICLKYWHITLIFFQNFFIAWVLRSPFEVPPKTSKELCVSSKPLFPPSRLSVHLSVRPSVTL